MYPGVCRISVRLVRGFLFHVKAAEKAEGKGAVPCQLLIILIAAAGAFYHIMVLAQPGFEGAIVKGDKDQILFTDAGHQRGKLLRAAGCDKCHSLCLLMGGRLRREDVKAGFVLVVFLDILR